MGGWMGEWMGGWVVGFENGWEGGRMDAWVGSKIHGFPSFKKHLTGIKKKKGYTVLNVYTPWIHFRFRFPSFLFIWLLDQVVLFHFKSYLWSPGKA